MGKMILSRYLAKLPVTNPQLVIGREVDRDNNILTLFTFSIQWIK